MDILYKNEKPLFIINLIISLLIWIILIFGTVGVALIWILFFFTNVDDYLHIMVILVNLKYPISCSLSRPI